MTHERRQATRCCRPERPYKCPCMPEACKVCGCSLWGCMVTTRLGSKGLPSKSIQRKRFVESAGLKKQNSSIRYWCNVSGCHMRTTIDIGACSVFPRCEMAKSSACQCQASQIALRLADSRCPLCGTIAEWLHEATATATSPAHAACAPTPCCRLGGALRCCTGR